MNQKTEYQFKYIPVARRYITSFAIFAMIIIVVQLTYQFNLLHTQRAETIFNTTIATFAMLGILCLFRFPLTGIGIFEKDCVIVKLANKQKSAPYRSIVKIESGRYNIWRITIRSQKNIIIMPPGYIFKNSQLKPFMVALAVKVEALTHSNVISDVDRKI